MRYVIRYDLKPRRRDIQEALQAELNKQRLAQRVRKIESVTCPEHKKHATVSMVDGALQAEICCRKLEAAIREEFEPE